ncbi:30S ribosomal protein S6 [bacterium]|nr:30S ribosomal protein S6 [bacterium]
MKQEITKEEKTGKFFYELSFWLKPQLEEEEVSQKVSQIQRIIQEEGGYNVEASLPKLKLLAYPIKKETSGYFIYIQFEISPEKLLAVEQKLKQEQDILRYLIVKREKRKTSLFSPVRKKKEKKAISTRTEPEKITAVDLQELDKKLDEILKE